MKIFFLSLIIVLSIPVSAQKKKLVQKFANTITAGGLREHLEKLAGNNMEGRATATKGQQKAAAYIQEQFVKLGLKPGVANGYQMAFPVFRDSVTEASITVNGTNYIPDSDFGVFTDNNHACDLKFSEVVFAGYGIHTAKYDDYKDLDVAGRLVVVYSGEPKKDDKYLISGNKNQSQWSFPPAKVDVATKLGAAGLLIIETNFPMKLYNYKLSNPDITAFEFYQPVNTFFISEKIASAIFKEKYNEIKNKAGRDSLTSIDAAETQIMLTYFRKQLELQSTNVLGMIEGTDKKNEYVLITAHYDHLGIKGGEIYPGADDNGSGTATVIKIAEAFAKARDEGSIPRRTLVFMLVSGEENGLWGSYFYTSHPVYPLEQITVNLNMDMVGRTDFEYNKDKDSVNYIYVIGDDKLSSELRPINESANKITRLKLDYKYNDLKNPKRYYYRSDHFNFASKGVPVIFYTDGEHADYHKPSDISDKINYDLLSRRAQLIFYTAWEIANKDSMLKRDLPLPK